MEVRRKTGIFTDLGTVRTSECAALQDTWVQFMSTATTARRPDRWGLWMMGPRTSHTGFQEVGGTGTHS